jgi:hypothetical protein
MRSNLLKISLAVALAGAAVVLLGQSAAAQESRNSLLGAWQVQVTQVDCQSGTPLGPSFPSLLTFAIGGTMIEDTSNPGFAAGQRGDGQGQWHYRGGNTYGAKSVAFIKFTTPPDSATHNPGFNLGQQTITQTITMTDNNDWTSTADIRFADATGAVYRQGCATASAKRF